MPSLAEMFPAYQVRGPSIGAQPGTFAGLPINALAAILAQRGAGTTNPGAPSLAGLTALGGQNQQGGSDLERAMQAISAIESGSRGGNYGLMGPVTRTGDRAYGRYQVMGANIGPWTRQHLGRAMTPQEFLADQAAQDAVFRGQFGSYLSRYGNPSDAASMWFTGRPYSVGHTRSDAIPGVHPGLTGAQYVSRFLAGY